jgi:hypothetical protein
MFEAHLDELTLGSSLLLKVENDRLVLSKSNIFHVKDIVIGLSQETKIESFRNLFRWLSVKVSKIEEDIITFDIIRFHRDDRYRISARSYNTQKIRKVVLESENTNGILTFAERVNSQHKSTSFSKLHDDTETSSQTSFPSPKIQQQKPSPDPLQTIPIETEKTMEISVLFSDVQFSNGYASSSKNIYVNELSRTETFEFDIENPFLCEEFNDIKPYFSKMLQIRRINITLNILVKKNKSEVLSATSKEIDRINEDLIEQVPRATIVNYLVEGIQDDNGHPVSDLIANSLAKTFKIDQKAFMDTLSNEYTTKHPKQLQYLSNAHNSKIVKLRFYKNPISFLFCIGDEKKYHFIWETFKHSLGTYIWSYNESEDVNARNSLRQNLIRVESVIKEINSSGRNPYIIKRDPSFNRVRHAYDNAGFDKWKKEIEVILLSGDAKS